MKKGTRFYKDVMSHLERTIYSSSFVPSDYEVVHVSEGKLYFCSQVAESLEEDAAYSGDMSKVSFSEYGTYLMSKDTQEVFKLDDNARSQLFCLAKTSGPALYNNTLFADISLYYAIQRLQDLQKVVVRDKNRIISVLSPKTNLRNPLPTIEQLKTSYELESSYIDDYKIVAEFLIANKNGRKYTVRFSWSDAGEVSYRLEGCVKNEQAERSVVLFEAETVAEAVDSLERYYDIDTSKRVSVAVLKKTLKALGKKRISMLLTKIGTFEQLLNVPDTVGSINNTTDREIERNIGALISHNL